MVVESDLCEDELSKEEDWKRNYYIVRLIFGILIMLLFDVVKEGDLRRLFQFIKIVLLFFYIYGRVKYVYVVFLFLVKFYVILLSGMVFEFIYNRFFSVFGKVGGNIFLDIRMEYFNKLLKIVLKQFGLNISEDVV